MDVYTNNFQVVPAPPGDAINKGGKVLLPSSVLEDLSTKRVVYPLNFQIRTYESPKTTHCGVLEFTAVEGQVVMPRWVMHHLGVKAGDPVQLQTVALPKAGLTKLRPREYKFTELHNPRVVLENVMKSFSCISLNDPIPVTHGSESFTLDVMELSSIGGSQCKAASVIDTDLKVDFDRPLDMPDSPVRPAPSSGTVGEAVAGGGGATWNFSSQTNFAPPSLGATPNISSGSPAAPVQKTAAFSGAGRSLGGGRVTAPAPAPTTTPSTQPSGPTYSTPSGGRTLGGGTGGAAAPAAAPAASASGSAPAEEEKKTFTAFQGKGRSLKG